MTQIIYSSLVEHSIDNYDDEMEYISAMRKKFNVDTRFMRGISTGKLQFVGESNDVKAAILAHYRVG